MWTKPVPVSAVTKSAAKALPARLQNGCWYWMVASCSVGNGEVRRQRPWRGRPNHDESFLATDDGKFHEHALADVIGIFHLCFGERSATGNTPVNRFLAAINKAFRHDVREQAQFVRLVFHVQREIGIFPIAQNAEAFKLRALQINIFAGINLAGFANRGGIGRCVTGLAHILRDFEFDWQPVAIPAWNVGRAFATQGLILDDDVLENFVQRGADMDVAIGKRRAIV